MVNYRSELSLQSGLSRGDVALQYGLAGFSVIPLLPKGKTPLIEWKCYQAERASQKQIQEWWKRWPDANIGIVTGKISGIVVVDIDIPDKKDGVLLLADTSFIVRTGSGGYHLYYLYPKGHEYIPSKARIDDGVDVRADGGYVVAPGSIHPNGGRYEWI
jgi:hypothetical protein